MKVYTYSQARQSLAELLETARKTGMVRIRRRDGQSFLVRPEKRRSSPLDIGGVDLGLEAEEIVAIIRESRRNRS